jgi:hypothetical protein
VYRCSYRAQNAGARRYSRGRRETVCEHCMGGWKREGRETEVVNRSRVGLLKVAPARFTCNTADATNRRQYTDGVSEWNHPASEGGGAGARSIRSGIERRKPSSEVLRRASQRDLQATRAQFDDEVRRLAAFVAAAPIVVVARAGSAVHGYIGLPHHTSACVVLPIVSARWSLPFVRFSAGPGGSRRLRRDGRVYTLGRRARTWTCRGRRFRGTRAGPFGSVWGAINLKISAGGMGRSTRAYERAERRGRVEVIAPTRNAAASSDAEKDSEQSCSGAAAEASGTSVNGRERIHDRSARRVDALQGDTCAAIRGETCSGGRVGTFLDGGWRGGEVA